MQEKHGQNDSNDFSYQSKGVCNLDVLIQPGQCFPLRNQKVPSEARSHRHHFPGLANPLDVLGTEKKGQLISFL